MMQLQYLGKLQQQQQRQILEEEGNLKKVERSTNGAVQKYSPAEAVKFWVLAKATENSWRPEACMKSNHAEFRERSL